MPHPDEFQLEFAQLDAPAGLDFVQAGRREKTVLLQFVAHDPQGEGRAENRHVDDLAAERAGPRYGPRGRGSERPATFERLAWM
jgi:hypothetical protein